MSVLRLLMDLTRHDKSKARSLRHTLESSEDIRDIGPPPACSDPALRAKVDADLESFLREIFLDVFRWPFSSEQQQSIRAMDGVIDRGGLKAVADPRGTGKTNRALRAALKAILTGKRKYVCVVAATEKKARNIIKALKTILCGSKLLYGLYPNEIHGFPQLKGSNHKARGQLCLKEPTGISILADQIVFPTIPGSNCSGAMISACGITGDVRGQFQTRQDGSVIRPDLILLDDPQTKESARSPDQCQQRMEIIEGDVLGLAGPDTAIACFALVTVVELDDLAEMILRTPKWHGTRTKTINKFPDNMKAWDAYNENMDEAIRLGLPERINASYLEQRDVLDAGCELAWEHRQETGTVSAIQTAMHLYYRVGPVAFGAEYQNEPVVSADEAHKPTFAGLEQKLIGIPRGVVPDWATKLTMCIDVQMTCLYWMVVAWADDFTGHIVDYGCWPEQSRSYFILRDVHPTLQDLSKSTQPQGAIRWGLDTLTQHLLPRQWLVEKGQGTMQIGKVLIDARYHPDTIHEFAKRSPHGAIILPCQGEGLTAGKLPMERWARRADETLKWHVCIKQRNPNRVTRGRIDIYHWKCFACERSAAILGERGALSVFGEKPELHRLLVDHLAAEFPVKTFSADGRVIWEWKQRPGLDNHWLDTLTSSCVAAYLMGCQLSGSEKFKDGSERRVAALPPRRSA